MTNALMAGAAKGGLTILMAKRFCGREDEGRQVAIASEGANVGDTVSANRAARNFLLLMDYVANLYCSGGSSSLSTLEVRDLAMSVSFSLGIADASSEEVACVLDVDDPIALWRGAIAELEERTEGVLRLWREVVGIMPPIRNVALRDTLVSLGDLKRRYDVYFAAHVVPCDIDYQLSSPVDVGLMGLDYVEAWLSQLLTEVRWIARFEVDSCVAVLERVCPDYRGLHINLYDLLLPHEDAELS